MAYDNSIPASFLKNNIAPNSQVTIGNIDFSNAITTADGDKLAIDPTNFVDTGLGQYATFQGWTFITAPEDISWDIANQSNRIDMFGTNNPPVVAGTKGMRDLSLGNSLVEGFVRGVTVEGKLSALEKLTNYKDTLSDGFVSVPVYQVWANEKAYGGGYYIIKDVKIKESIRDLKGDATRAYVDISFMEVPKYQVNSGRDLASEPAAAAKSILPSQREATKAQQAAAQTASVKSSVDKNVTPATKAGAAAPTSKPAKNTSTKPITPRDLNQPSSFSAPPGTQ